MKKAKFALVGLGVMGQNLALNIANKGYPVVVYNRTASVIDEFIDSLTSGQTVTSAYSYAD